MLSRNHKLNYNAHVEEWLIVFVEIIGTAQFLVDLCPYLED